MIIANYFEDKKVREDELQQAWQEIVSNSLTIDMINSLLHGINIMFLYSKTKEEQDQMCLLITELVTRKSYIAVQESIEKKEAIKEVWDRR